MEFKLDHASIAKSSEKWQYLYLGCGVGFSSAEYIFYRVMGGFTAFAALALICFGMSLANMHVKEWALQKMDEKTK